MHILDNLLKKMLSPSGFEPARPYAGETINAL